jgi:lactate dehydrogenase-like 2-hydroxyacid dehydrogenase
MATPDIIVTAPLPPFLYDPLKADYRCHDYVQAADKPAFLAACGGIVRGLVQGGGTVTPPTLLDALPGLEIISVFGVGYDGVPVDYCRKRGIKVTNTPDVLTDDVADVAVGLVLMCGRGFVRANRFVHAGDWLKRGPELTTNSPAGRPASWVSAASARRSRSGSRRWACRSPTPGARRRRMCPIGSCPISRCWPRNPIS